jgi:hypothetical protein
MANPASYPGCTASLTVTTSPHVRQRILTLMDPRCKRTELHRNQCRHAALSLDAKPKNSVNRHKLPDDFDFSYRPYVSRRPAVRERAWSSTA